MGWTQIIRQHRDCGTLYNILYPFSASVVQLKKNFFCSLHKMMETGELFVIYRECDEDRSSETAMGEGGAQRPALQVNELKKTGARSARARTRGQNPLVSLYMRKILFSFLSVQILAKMNQQGLQEQGQSQDFAPDVP